MTQRPLDHATTLYRAYDHLHNTPAAENWDKFLRRNLVQGVFNRDIWVVRVNYGYNALESFSHLPSALLNAVLRTVVGLISFFKGDTGYFSPKANFNQAWKNLGYQLFSTVDCTVGVITPALACKLNQWRLQGYSKVHVYLYPSVPPSAGVAKQPSPEVGGG